MISAKKKRCVWGARRGEESGFSAPEPEWQGGGGGVPEGCHSAHPFPREGELS